MKRRTLDRTIVQKRIKESLRTFVLTIVLLAALALPLPRNGHSALAISANRTTFAFERATTLANEAQAEVAIAVITFVVETVLTVQKNQTFVEINARLAQIEKRLAVIEAKLDEALTILRNLHVYFKETSDYEARQRVIKSWKVVLRKYPIWSANPASIAKYANEIRQEYAILSREAADLATRESFANFHIIAIAMATENDLMRLLPDQEPFRARTFAEYENYFLGTHDPNLPGSVGGARARVERQRSDIEKAHGALQKPLYSPITHEEDKGRCRYQLAEPIIGGLQDGYRFKGEHCFYREVTACTAREPRGGEGRGGDAVAARPGDPTADFVFLGAGKRAALLDETSLLDDIYGRFFCTVNYASPSVAQLEADRVRWNRLRGDLKELDAAAAIAKRLQVHAGVLAK